MYVLWIPFFKGTSGTKLVYFHVHPDFYLQVMIFHGQSWLSEWKSPRLRLWCSDLMKLYTLNKNQYYTNLKILNNHLWHFTLIKTKKPAFFKFDFIKSYKNNLRNVKITFLSIIAYQDFIQIYFFQVWICSIFGLKISQFFYLSVKTFELFN